MIKVDQLDIRFGSKKQCIQAVKNVSFEVKEGESYGLVGESGSGKSTILRALIGLLPDWQGVLTIDKHAVTQWNRQLRRQMQMVFQDPYGSLHPRHTVNDALREPLMIHGIGQVNQRIEQALIEVGLGPQFRFRYPHQISGGQRQRVAIARALILQPRILLLDEPTSALDVSVQAEVLNLLQTLHQRHGLTYIMVSHDLSVVGHLCSRIGVMNQGVLVEEMTREQLQSGDVEQAYTRQLWQASRGYDRAVLESTAV